MITKNDLIILLTDLQESENDTEASNLLMRLYTKNADIVETIKYINERRPIEVAEFYEKLRKSYNNKKSDLYINIVKETDDLNDILTTLASYNLQVLLFSKKLDKNKDLFLKTSRVQEVAKVLYNYYQTYNIEDCYKVLLLIKSDIKLFEHIRKS